jgi:dipeptidyl aminopeptidase/acylaminoacyl peptidase
MVAHFVNPDTGEVVRALPPPDPSLELFCGGSWSPDGKRISCERYGVKDPSLNDIYTIRTSDGGGLRRITSSPDGGYDIPGDFSPDGERLVFVRWVDDEPVGVFVTEFHGSGVVQISRPDLVGRRCWVLGELVAGWEPDPVRGPRIRGSPQGDLDRRGGRQLATPLRDDAGVRGELLG